MKGFIFFVYHQLIMRKKLYREYLSPHDTRKKHTSPKFIGKTLASYSYPSTIDGYWFIVSPSTLIVSFVFVRDYLLENTLFVSIMIKNNGIIHFTAW
jgi:hypothetical protein